MLTGGKSKFGPTGTAALQGQDGDASQKNMFGELVLFFGSRSKNADYYFKDDWVELGVRVFPAFSRDPIATASTPPSTEEPERRDNSLPIRTRSRADPAVAAEIADSNISTQPETAVPAPSVGLSSLLTGDSELLVKSGDKGESLDLVNKTLVRTEDRRHITVVRPKRYVQHVLLENYDVVCDLVKKGCRVMICGSRGRMPSEVKMALAECLVRRELARDIDHANSILSSMVEIWEEVW